MTEWNRHIEIAERAQRAGKYDFAEATWMLAVEEAESFGERDHRLAYSLEKLTECLWFQGRLEEALRYATRALTIYERSLGPNHTDVGTMAYNLAMVYHVLNYFKEAEQHYKRSLAIKTGNLGATHPEVVKILGSFADLLVRLGRDDEARQLRATEKVVTAANWSQTVSARNVGGKALGFSPSQASVSGTYPVLRPDELIVDQAKPQHASLIKNIRKASAENPYQLDAPVPLDDEQKEAYKRKVSFTPPTQGQPAAVAQASPAPTPVSTFSGGQPIQHITDCAKLGLPLSGSFGSSWEELKTAAERGLSEGNLTQAEGAWREAMTVAKGNDPRNPTYCFVLECLGEVYLRQQNFQRAETCLRTAYDFKIAVLTKDHPAVAGSVSNLARLYYMTYQFAEAERFGEMGIQIQEKLHGPSSIEAATALHNMATVYHVQKKYERAEPYYERAMKLKQAQLGGDHPDTVRILKSYANLLRATHREEQAEHLDQCVSGMISGRWRAVQATDAPQEGWWKQALFDDQ